MREISLFIAELPEALLQVQRDRIVDLRPYVPLRQVGPQRIAILRSNHELVVDVARRVRRQLDDLGEAGVLE